MTEQEHPDLVAFREDQARAIAQGYTKGDVNHYVQPVIGILRLLERDNKPLTDANFRYFIDSLSRACDAEIAWLHSQGEL